MGDESLTNWGILLTFNFMQSAGDFLRSVRDRYKDQLPMFSFSNLFEENSQKLMKIKKSKMLFQWNLDLLHVSQYLVF